MRIADNLRQECMPDMVYSLCKLAQRNLKKEELLSLITLGSVNKESIDQFNQVYNFSRDSGMIRETEGTVFVNFSEQDLSSFRRFSYAAFREVFQENNAFTQLAKWYLSQEIPVNPEKGKTLLNPKSYSEFILTVPNTLKNDMDENYFNGFRFWMTALGLTAFYAPGSGMSSVPLLFAAHKALGAWIEFGKPFQSGSMIEAGAFFEKLKEDCPVFSMAINEKTNSVSAPLAMGLRVLENSNRIQMIKQADASNLWHLSKSVVYQKNNEISMITIKETENG